MKTTNRRYLGQNQPQSNPNSFYHGVVVNNIDTQERNRIQVRILSRDDGVSDSQLEWCISINPAGFFMIPMIGEHVIVFLRNPMTQQSGRFYSGPIHSQYDGEYEGFKNTVEKLEIEKNGL